MPAPSSRHGVDGFATMVNLLNSLVLVIPEQQNAQCHSACSLVSFWADKPGSCWFVVREKYYTMADKS